MKANESRHPGQLTKVASIEKDSKVVIFCSEDHHTMLGKPEDRKSTWDDTTWQGKDNKQNEAFVKIGMEVGFQNDLNAPAPQPRKTICASDELIDAYTSIGTFPLPALNSV